MSEHKPQVIAWMKCWRDHVPPNQTGPLAFNVAAGSSIHQHADLDWWMPPDTEVTPLVAASELERLQRRVAELEKERDDAVQRWMAERRAAEAAISWAAAACVPKAKP